MSKVLQQFQVLCPSPSLDQLFNTGHKTSRKYCYQLKCLCRFGARDKTQYHLALLDMYKQFGPLVRENIGGKTVGKETNDCFSNIL